VFPTYIELVGLGCICSPSLEIRIMQDRITMLKYSTNKWTNLAVSYLALVGGFIAHWLGSKPE